MADPVASRQLTQVYLDVSQKSALQKRARAKGTKVAEEIRSAVDAYLSGISPDELELLDMASRQAANELQAMSESLDATNRKLDAVFNELERMRVHRDDTA